MGAERRILPIVGPPAEKLIYVGGHRFTLTAWSREQWARLAESERPDDAHAIGEAGWLTIRPVPET
jgi:hypothetical protein